MSGRFKRFYCSHFFNKWKFVYISTQSSAQNLLDAKEETQFINELDLGEKNESENEIKAKRLSTYSDQKRFLDEKSIIGKSDI